MNQRITVVGGAAIGDYIFHVDHLPEKGEIVLINQKPQPLVPGGCAPNIAAGIAALGKLKPVLCYPVGDDTDTVFMHHKWESRGIECNLTEVPNIESGRSWMFMQNDGTTMCFGYPGAADFAIPDTSNMEKWVIISPVLNSFTKTYLIDAVASKRNVVVTGIGSADLIDYLASIKVLVINKCECASLCKAGGWRNASELSSEFPNLLMYVTYGGSGSVLYQHGIETNIAVVRANQITDFTGAGDAYTSGLVSALLSGYDPIISGWIGSAHASFVVEQFGGQDISFPTWNQIEKRLSEQFGINIIK